MSLAPSLKAGFANEQRCLKGFYEGDKFIIV